MRGRGRAAPTTRKSDRFPELGVRSCLNRTLNSTARAVFWIPYPRALAEHTTSANTSPQASERATRPRDLTFRRRSEAVEATLRKQKPTKFFPEAPDSVSCWERRRVRWCAPPHSHCSSLFDARWGTALHGLSCPSGRHRWNLQLGSENIHFLLPITDISFVVFFLNTLTAVHSVFSVPQGFFLESSSQYSLQEVPKGEEENKNRWVHAAVTERLVRQRRGS